jgi:arabinogalactan oligomer/maltooligosaccharide transport system permease protein
MTTIEYLSLPVYKRAIYKIGAILISIPKAIWHFLSVTLLHLFTSIGKKVARFFVNIVDVFKSGDWKTRTSFLVMGFGHITRKSLLKGFMYFIYQVVFIAFMFSTGIEALTKIGTFGYMGANTIYYDVYEEIYVYVTVSTGDDSVMVLMNFVITILLMAIYVFLWSIQVMENSELQNLNKIGKGLTDKDTLKSLVGKNFHKVLLSFPTLGLAVFTIMPLIVMILVAFTNYSSAYMNPKHLFDWVGVYNFQKLFGMAGAGGQAFAYVFGKILLWTLIWAVFATFSNYFMGMVVALMINKKGIKFKKVWRTILITTIAVPQFISLLFLSRLLLENGGINSLLLKYGIIEEAIPFLSDALTAKITIIVVNMWIGIPYTMLMCSGLLLNIPADLYESAKIDGANPVKMYSKITLPYMLFVTGPYLISSFVGNINNFNVIYLLSGGGPMFTTINGVTVNTNQIYSAGQTDLLITWLYKMCMTSTEKNYAIASVIGICIFIVLASISLVVYSRSSAVKNEEDFR